VKEIRWLPESLAELDEIWARIAIEDPGAADRLIDRIMGATERLSRHPGSGHRRDDLPERYRVVNAPPYLVVYCEHPDSVDVLSVRHGNRLFDDLRNRD
jgi:toxin ParE1/3/4